MFIYTGVLERILQVEAKGDCEIGFKPRVQAYHTPVFISVVRRCKTEHMGKT